jgi:hypothetical protein
MEPAGSGVNGILGSCHPRQQAEGSHEKGAQRTMTARDEQFIDLKGTSRDLKPTYHFMMKCLLYSRMETGLTSNKDYYDEDVNVYIAHLLNSFINPRYIEQASTYLSKYDTEVFGRLADSKDARLKYTLYKTNADFLLVSLGLFDNPSATAPEGQSSLVSASNRAFQPSEEAHVGRGKTYYRFAYSYSQQIHNPHAAITEVLEKLSVGFEKYLRILSHMRGEYLNLLDRLTHGDVYHLQRTVNEAKKSDELRAKQDRFLDLYTEWKRGGDPRVRSEIQELIVEIKAVDPSFTFELPKKHEDVR